MSVNLIFKIAAVGILVTVLSQVLKHSGREEHAFLTSLAGLIIVLFWIMAIMDGWRGIKETWPAVVVAGGSFAIAQYLSSNFIGPELPDIIS